MGVLCIDHCALVCVGWVGFRVVSVPACLVLLCTNICRRETACTLMPSGRRVNLQRCSPVGLCVVPGLGCAGLVCVLLVSKAALQTVAGMQETIM